MASREEEITPESLLIRQQLAQQELAGIFDAELGFTDTADFSEGERATPLRIVTELRDSNPDAEYTRDQALAELLEAKKVPYTTAVRVGILWGASYGQQTLGDTVERMIDNADLSGRERILAEEMIVGATQGLVRAYKETGAFTDDSDATETRDLVVDTRNFEGYLDLTRDLLKVKPRAAASRPLREKIAEIASDPGTLAKLADSLDGMIEDHLTPRAGYIIRARRALVGFGSTPVPEDVIAEQLSISPERVTQIERKSVNKLRVPSRISRITPFFGIGTSAQGS